MRFTKWITCSVALLSFFITDCLQAKSGVKGNKADYVIVGVGTAGALLAKKLTDDKKTSVIALHTGKNFTESFIIKYSKNTVFSVLSAMLGTLNNFDFSSLDLPPSVQKQFSDLLQLTATTARPLYETGESTPQFAADDRQILWVLPLPFAGASSINAGAWCRGTNQLFSQWEAIAGSSWSIDRILKVYKKLEDYHGKTTNPNSRGHDGPLRVLQNTPISNLSKVFSQAVSNATGFPIILDYNDPNTPIGVCPQMQLTHKGHLGFLRDSSAVAFLNKDVMKPSGKGVDGRKLKVLFNSFGLKTIWEGTKAVGVEYMQDGEIKKVYAKKGVIICAGLRSSPFLLYSGVGPSNIINNPALGINPVFENINVGLGLADQPNVVTLWSSNPNDSAAGSNSVFAQISWLPAPGGDPTSRQLRFTTVDAIPGITAALLDLCQPQSRGSVSINSPNPLDPPVVDLGILSNSDDLDLFVAGFQTYIQNINIALQEIDPQYQLLLPPPEILEDTALLTEFIQESVASNFHYQSHCRMAPYNNGMLGGGVVDSNGRVYGVQNLFVADNSVNPQGMDGSPMATGYLVAYNIAKLLGH